MRNRFHFEETNVNPKHRKVGDCVIRAISYALKTPWDKVYRDLAERGVKHGYMPNDKANFNAYLKDLGIPMEKMPKRFDNTKYTVKEFANEIADSNKRYIISVANHLTVLDGSTLIDTWDCSEKSCGNYWIVKK